MMKFISKDNLLAWLQSLIEEKRLIAPVIEDELSLFKVISKVDQIDFGCGNTVLSPKDWFFPATETLFQIIHKNGDVELMPKEVAEESVIFGIRPCDAKALAEIDKPFYNEPSDDLYRQHRDKTVLIGIACKECHPQCFCTSLETAPNNATNVDMLLTEVDGGYLVEEVTDKGKALLESAAVEESDTQKPEPPTPSLVPTEGIIEATRQVFDDAYWDRLADRCIHCNLCAYVCPTCYCFDVRDYTEGERSERIRTWESCQSPGFTKIAGGYTPRPTKGSRLRQRFCHKLLYFAEQFGDNSIACVGCGRCVVACPVNIDIREIISDIQRLGAKGGSGSG